jgi:hypothetical protein
VPRKCNTLIIINNKIRQWMQDRQGKELEGIMIPQERGKVEGLSLHIFKLFLFYSPWILERKRGLHKLLGGRPHYAFDI